MKDLTRRGNLFYRMRGLPEYDDDSTRRRKILRGLKTAQDDKEFHFERTAITIGKS